MRELPMKLAPARWRCAVVAVALGCAAMAGLQGQAFSAPGDERTVPDRWTAEQRATLAAMALERLPAREPDPSNAVDGRPGAVALGERLFQEPRLSRDGTVSCASCHQAQHQFQDGKPLAQGLGAGTRRTMPIAGAGYGPWRFWDGRKDSLWSQALGPLEDAAEHGGNRTRLARVLLDHYRAEYEALFGPAPDLAGLPRDAGPLGDLHERQAWEHMTARQQAAVNRVFANLGKAIAAYERTLRPGESRLDRYVRATLSGDAAGQRVLDAQEVRGLRLFVGKAQCATCHNGPLLSDQAFHNTGVPPLDLRRPDRGRAAAVARVQADEFNCLGPFSDAQPGQCAELRFMATGDAALEGAFKTPGLRNVALRPPYMHAGQMATLEDAVAHYARPRAAVVGRSELLPVSGDSGGREPVHLTPQEVADLVRFLGALSGPMVQDSPQ
jgi:cytochrome c peroxidase